MIKHYFNVILNDIRLIIGLIFCVGLILIFSMMRSPNAILNMKITNIKEIKGELVIAIYDKKENYPKEGMEFKKLMVKVDDSITKCTIEDLPLKEYAVAVFHDINSDGKCNRNLLGRPTEAYGFSNNIKPRLTSPPYKKVKFQLNESKLITIRLIQKKKDN